MTDFHGVHAVMPGWPVGRLETPTLVVDLDAMERNIARMATYARQRGMRWRPHAKMHKSATLALRLIAAGATGCCVQKLAEAQALAAGGVQDIYLSNQVVAQTKLQRLAQLAGQLQQRGGRLALAVDSVEGIRRVAAALESAAAGRSDWTDLAPLDVYIEVDVGQGRAGVAPGEPAVPLALELARHAALRLAGLHPYHGGAQHIVSAAERASTMQAAYARVHVTLAALQAAGFDNLEVTGAGTGTFALEAGSGLYTELQPGSFLFMDAHYARVQPAPGQPVFEHALFVRTQVISRSAQHAVVDAGHKSHAIDSGLPTVWNFGAPPLYAFANGGDEHGLITALDGATTLPQLGDCLWLVPGHCDPTVNLHDALVGVRGGLVEGQVEALIRVDARGALW